MKKTVGFECRTLSNLIKRKVDGINAEKDLEGLTASQGRILGFLNARGDEVCYQKDVEEHFNCRRSTMTEMLKLREQNGFIQRKNAPHDQRLKMLTLTDKGRLVLEETLKTFDGVEKDMLEGISDEDLETFFAVIDKCKQNLLK